MRFKEVVFIVKKKKNKIIKWKKKQQPTSHGCLQKWRKIKEVNIGVLSKNNSKLLLVVVLENRGTVAVPVCLMEYEIKCHFQI